MKKKIVDKYGKDLLRDPLLNKGTAFSKEERKKFDKSTLRSHKNIVRSEEVNLSDFTKSMTMVFDESDATEKEMWVYEKTCRCGDTYEFTETDLHSGFNTTQCHGCSLYVTIV